MDLSQGRKNIAKQEPPAGNVPEQRIIFPWLNIEKIRVDSTFCNFREGVYTHLLHGDYL